VIHNAQFAPWLKQVLLAIQAYDVYHAFWFDFLLAMFFVNLAVCTYLRFPATWRRYAMLTPPMPPVASAQEVVQLQAAPSPLALDMFRKRGYRVSELANGAFFAEKNKFVRLNPTFIHISLFLIIAGGIVGGLTGLKNSIPVQVGESISSKDVVETSYLKGKLHGAPRPFDLRLDAFRMDFRPNGQVKQYYSEVTIAPQGGTPYRQTLWVNEPLVVDGMYFYQSFWGVGGLTYTVDGKPADLKLTQAKIGGYMSKPFQVGADEYMFFLRSPNEPCLIVSTKSFNPVSELVPGITKPLSGHQLGIKEYRFFSGLETKSDPGIPLVYLGCGILIFGLCMVPFSHREVWVRPVEGGWLLAGRTHKGRVMLRKEMEEIAEKWPGEAAPVPVAT
jgi:cytochrome c biogenesis protein